MKFGEKVRQARIAAHLSQQQLADRSGISLRTIQNYETGGRMPKQRDSYRRLASSLHMEESVLLDEQAEFVLAAGEEYGSHGSEQAQRLVEEISGLYAGGELCDEDMDAMMEAIQEAYWIAKRRNRRQTASRPTPAIPD